MTYTNGCDLSVWQGAVDFAKMKAAGAEFVFIRASLGETGRDGNFEANYAGARAAGLLVGAYHLFFPNLPAAGQIANINRVIGTRKLDLPLVLDVEMSQGSSPSTIAATLRQTLAGAPFAGSPSPSAPAVMIYTGPAWWTANLPRSFEWHQWPLFIANYTAAAQPTLPPDWQGWRFWQWSAGGNGRGPEYGAASKDIDLVRYAGSLDDLRDWCGLVQEPTLERRLADLEARVTALEAMARIAPPDDVDPAPDAPQVIGVTVVAGTANARYIYDYNSALRPVMEIYGATVAERIQYKAGERVGVWSNPITADGGGEYWKLAQRYGRAGEALYLRNEDVEA